MGSKNFFKTIEKELSEYRMIIGVLILVMLVTLSVLTYINFDKQNQIIETGGFTDGKVKCVCSEAAWNQFIANADNIEASNVFITDG